MSDFVRKVIRSLEDKQVEEEKSALNMKLGYEAYLSACGRYQGRQEALNLLLGILDEEEQKERSEDGGAS